MRTLVLGAGGIGGYFGGRLAASGADVTFLVRPRRRQQLDRDGLRIRSPLGDLDLAVRTVLEQDLRAGYDLVLLTCKAYDLAAAMTSISPAMDGTCAVLPLLNGIAHFAALDERFGPPQVIGGTCSINVTLDSDGVVHHAGRLQRFVFGERDGAASPRTTALADALARTTVDWTLSPDIEQDVWEKIVFLSVLAAATCLFRANVGEINAAPGGRDVIERALAANIQIATREGRPPRAAAIDFARKTLLDRVGTFSASMLRDLEAGRPVESDHIVGWMLDKAREHGVDDDVLALAYTHLKAYEVRRAAARLPG
jgi:2-dehydropantoate 2-reductase